MTWRTPTIFLENMTMRKISPSRSSGRRSRERRRKRSNARRRSRRRRRRRGEQEAKCVEKDGEDRIEERICLAAGSTDFGTDLGTDKPHSVDADGAGSHDDSRLLPVKPGDIAEIAGENGPMDNDCGEDEQSNLEEEDEFLTEEDAEAHNSEDAGDADIKQRLVQETSSRSYFPYRRRQEPRPVSGHRSS